MAIDQIVADPGSTPDIVEPRLAGMLEVASELRRLPRPGFQKRLKAELAGQASGHPLEKPRATTNAKPEYDLLPTLFGKGYGTYPVRRVNFVASVGLHVAAAVIVLSALWTARYTVQTPAEKGLSLSELAPYIPPAALTTSGGGGAGGAAEKLNASKGALPRSARTQIVPPTVIVANTNPKLTAEATVVVPDLSFPKDPRTGDPLSTLLVPSNGRGIRGGIGSNTGSGIGNGNGAGVGSGIGAGVGGGFYHVGNGVSAPRTIYDPDPEYSEEARKARFQGTVAIWAVVGADGRVYSPRLQQSVGLGLDEKALAAVRTWRFEPAMKDGHPVPVAISIDVAFRLY